ncbi:MAG: protease modulator HflC [Proteobacteria bacterium]|nr:protease modulator HflC [Pseudomonadota bacterium]
MNLSRKRLIAYGAAALAAVVVLANTLYVVDTRQQAVVLSFGSPVAVVNAANGKSNPGLKAKIPFLQNVVKFDRRNQALESEEEEIIAGDQERLVVDAFVRYRISDPLQFYRTVRDENTAGDRIERLLNSSLREVLGSAPSDENISRQRAQLMQQTLQRVRQGAESSRLGVQILDVRIQRADLPPQNQEAVYRRMQTARQQEAATIRARGEQQKREIVARANRDVAVTIAEAQAYEGQVKGEGDARRAEILGSAYGRDPGFAAFYRSMQAYETALGGENNTTMVISPDSAFFRYYERGAGGG